MKHRKGGMDRMKNKRKGRKNETEEHWREEERKNEMN